MKKLIVFVLVFMVSVVLLQSAFAESTAHMVNKANKLYREKKYDEALALYNRALTEEPESTIIQYNSGTAAYKKGDYDTSLASLEKSLATQNKELEARANFNLGNASYQRARKLQDTQLFDAVDSLQKALLSYKRAMELRPQDQDAKYNFELADKLLKELQEKLKQQSAQQEQEKKSREQEQNQQQQQQQQQQDTQQEGQNQQQKSTASEEKKEENQAGAQEQQPQQEKQSVEQQDLQPQNPDEMSRKEAEMLLNNFRQEEKTLGSLQDTRRGDPDEALKDW